ncbi:MAG: 50S ribosomal protein L31 [Bacillota bacterium]
MQKEIHPEMKETTVTCACGTSYKTKSTRENIRVEVCSNCHPFYTGKQRTSATGGRIERFKEKYGYNDENKEDEE